MAETTSELGSGDVIETHTALDLSRATASFRIDSNGKFAGDGIYHIDILEANDTALQFTITDPVTGAVETYGRN